MRITFRAAMTTIVTALPLALQAAPGHQHGVLPLDAVLDGPVLTVSFSLPLDSALGFERAPRSAAEKQAAQRLVERLRTDATLVQPDPAAGCTREEVTLASAALGLGGGEATGEHADIDASYRFRCQAPARLAHIDLGLVAAFARIARIEAQLVGAKGQARQVLRRPAQRLTWPR